MSSPFAGKSSPRDTGSPAHLNRSRVQVGREDAVRWQVICAPLVTTNTKKHRQQWVRNPLKWDVCAAGLAGAVANL